jgi:hypothetical protein
MSLSQVRMNLCRALGPRPFCPHPEETLENLKSCYQPGALIRIRPVESLSKSSLAKTLVEGAYDRI